MPQLLLRADIYRSTCAINDRNCDGTELCLATVYGSSPPLAVIAGAQKPMSNRCNQSGDNNSKIDYRRTMIGMVLLHTDGAPAQHNAAKPRAQSRKYPDPYPLKASPK